MAAVIDPDGVLVIENPELFKALTESFVHVRPFIADAMMDSMLIIQGELGYAGYPPSSEANLPGRIDENGEPMGYYERNRGWWYPVKRLSTLAGISGVAEGAQTIEDAYRRHKMPTKSIPVVENLRVLPGRERKRGGVVVEQSVNYYRERENVVAGYKLAKNKNGQPGTSEQLGKSWTTQLTSGDDFIQGEVGTPVSYADYVQGYKVPQFHKDRGWEDMPERLKRIMPQIDARFEQALEDYLAKFGEQ
ncbi:MAG TPA: hypothetical protein PLN86_16450 [Candidatus Hydrogenedentes bacterium]|nr:hypothetical protein [Candidatus Hydrogenedentota bacterium]